MLDHDDCFRRRYWARLHACALFLGGKSRHVGWLSSHTAAVPAEDHTTERVHGGHHLETQNLQAVGMATQLKWKKKPHI